MSHDQPRQSFLGSVLHKRAAVGVFAVVICNLFMLGGLALKANCSDAGQGNGIRRFGNFCYNDFEPLYETRRVEEGFPYVEGSLSSAGTPQGGAIEYPVLTGVFMWLAAQLADGPVEYFRMNAFLLFPFGLVTAYLLGRMGRWRALFFAAAPALVLYAFHNWDLLVVAAMVAGFFAWQKRRFGLAGFWFGLGAALKLYPALFALALVVDRAWHGDRHGARRVAIAAAGIFALVNIPFMLINFDGWVATYAFHTHRVPNLDSMWTWLSFDMSFQRPSTLPALNLLTSVLVGVSVVAILALGRRRATRSGDFPFLQVCAALLAAFLLWNKVHSPQYTLWIVPFFVLVNLRWWWWAAYSVVDIVVYAGVFGWFTELMRSSDIFEWTVAKGLMVGGVWARSLLLLFLIGEFMRAESSVVQTDCHSTSRPDTLQGARRGSSIVVA